jgi:hypothetical protein
MKSICLVERVKWKFAGNMNPHAFDFGDVDNDKVLKVIMKFLNVTQGRRQCRLQKHE